MNIESRDLVKSRYYLIVLWVLPQIIMLLSYLAETPLLGWVWASCLFIMGVGCVINAYRCGRLHCFFTGPFFILGASWSIAHEIGLITMDDNGWLIIGITMLIGGCSGTYIPEWIWGQYQKIEKTRLDKDDTC